ncbi:MAG: GH92 family glycosyl hydrolase [Prevotella sp.]|nr:GH92 family glycosyl hydrolase [Prevotella sp.]
MRRIFVSMLLLSATCGLFSQNVNPASYVNPFIGASTNVDAAGAYHGLGKTFPGAATPFGMVQVSPQTIAGGDNGSGYSYEHSAIEGFAMTQMSGVGWYGDLGNIMVMPTTGKMYTIAGREDGSVKGWRSRYDKATETATAGYYSAMLTDYNIKVETSATTHCGALRITYPRNEQSRLQIDLARRVGGTAEEQYAEVVGDNTIEGWVRCTPDCGGWGDGDGKAVYTIYFHAEANRPLDNYGFWSADIPSDISRHNNDVNSAAYQERVAKAAIIRGENKIQGRHVGFFAEFPTEPGEQIELKIAISFVDIEGARKNFMAEASGKTFENIRREAVDAWNQQLRCIEIEGGTADEKTIFYTALYHTMIDPRIYTDVDGRYVGGDYKPHQSDGTWTKRTIFSGWDVFRSQFPLQTIINPTLVNDMLCSLITLAEQSGKGYFERWELLNSYSGCMLGNPAISVLADAYAKGIRGYDIGKAYEYAKNSSARFGNDKLGYTPGKLGLSHTLEYAYTDWCIAQLAKALGKKADEKEYLKKSQAYRNLFDNGKHWFRPRNDDGSWVEWPKNGRLEEWYGAMESNALQQGWFVPHDVKGMTALMGGKKRVVADLQWMFMNTPQDMMWNVYYNHANEPVHFVPYLFNQLGAPYLTQYWTRYICSHAYKNKVEGLCGNEDVGQMSAWYVLSAAGIHQACPGDTRYEITSPVFNKIVFHQPNGKSFTVVANNNSPENIYIDHIMLNGKPLSRHYILHSEIAEGGVLELFMSDKPKKK